MAELFECYLLIYFYEFKAGPAALNIRRNKCF